MPFIPTYGIKTVQTHYKHTNLRFHLSAFCFSFEPLFEASKNIKTYQKNIKTYKICIKTYQKCIKTYQKCIKNISKMYQKCIKKYQKISKMYQNSYRYFPFVRVCSPCHFILNTHQKISIFRCNPKGDFLSFSLWPFGRGALKSRYDTVVIRTLARPLT